MAEIRKVRREEISLGEVQGLGRFVISLQKSDGSFYSKYTQETGVVSDWQSLYYPGEAALGLISLYEIDRSRKWLVAAGKGLSYLAKRRAGAPEVPPDHWALIATAKLLSYCGKVDCAISRQELVRHAVQVSEALLRQQITSTYEPEIDGSFDPTGRTAPTATRMEGLLAALEFLPNDQSELRHRIETASQRGVAFLLRAQIKSGRYAGGIPGAIVRADVGAAQANSQGSKIRIDYVQHAMCALLRYQKMFPAPGVKSIPVTAR
jgi:hypothetical protein